MGFTGELCPVVKYMMSHQLAHLNNSTSVIPAHILALQIEMKESTFSLCCIEANNNGHFIKCFIKSAVVFLLISYSPLWAEWSNCRFMVTQLEGNFIYCRSPTVTSVLSSTGTHLHVWPSLWWTMIGCPPMTLPGRPLLLWMTSVGRRRPVHMEGARWCSHSSYTCPDPSQVVRANLVVECKFRCHKHFNCWNDSEVHLMFLSLENKWPLFKNNAITWISSKRCFHFTVFLTFLTQTHRFWRCWKQEPLTGRHRSLSENSKKFRNQSEKKSKLYTPIRSSFIDTCFLFYQVDFKRKALMLHFVVSMMESKHIFSLLINAMVPYFACMFFDNDCFFPVAKHIKTGAVQLFSVLA